MKRVMHVFGIMNRGGAELRTLALMPAMEKLGYEFHFCVLSGKTGVLDDEIRRLGGQVHYCPLGASLPWRFIKLLKAQQIDILHSHVALVSGFLVSLARLAGVRLRIAHLRSTHDGGQSTYLRRLRDHFLRCCMRCNSQRILGVCAGALARYWPNWSADPQFRLVYNGLDIQDIPKQNNFWQAYGLTETDSPVVINLARMDKVKNHLRQVSMFADFCTHFPHARMVFVGKENPETKAAMLTLAKARGIESHLLFLGEQGNPLPLLRHADAMLFPSKWEGLPGAVLEALSLGTPVLATRLPGTEEIAAQIDGLQVMSLEESDQHWAAALAQLLEQQADRKALVTQFRQSDFVISKNIDTLHAIYLGH
ncbi:glycosyltransferase [Aliiglaciecola sp. CAU 1673]|uniref:glycosyltransferase n=1 Tax=Aliiglaciecola sp. CAU 1673 TaxID=3032595 RepID=UPI0023DBE046|nr:glycosyltransferase [Aliiglaciecola sp. CAU 1673]MDF2179788.1 glycosyltransferase [Aliiglaciecola sp. CAU 1673]